jgi:hypothetical protein
MMNVEQAIQQLRENSEIIRAMVHDIADEAARWRPEAESWSVLEVINHLHDEEREDFREHLDWILYRADEPWASIDPQGWVSQRQYNSRHFDDSLAAFLRERQRSLAWLAALSEVDWTAVQQTPWRSMTGGDMLASWVAHDLLHMRQLVELRWALMRREFADYDVAYAGGW